MSALRIIGTIIVALIAIGILGLVLVLAGAARIGNRKEAQSQAFEAERKSKAAADGQA